MKLIVKTSIAYHDRRTEAFAEIQDVVAVDREELSAAVLLARQRQTPDWDWAQFEADLWAELDRIAR